MKALARSHVWWPRLDKDLDFAEKDKRHYLVLIDFHSKWPEIIHMTSTRASATVDSLCDVFSRFGLPGQVT